MQFIERFKAARRVSVPIVAIETTDPAATIANLMDTTNGAPIVQWDISKGFIGRNDKGQEVARSAADTAGNPPDALKEMEAFPEDSVLFVLNANYFLNDVDFNQSVWNLRDRLKQNGRMLVLLGRSFAIPPELQGDIVLIDEPLPSEDDLKEIVETQIKDAEIEGVSQDVIDKAVVAVTGLPAFQAEQITAMALHKGGIHVDELWESKRKQIEQTKGLSVDRESITYKDIGGLCQVKDFGYRLFHGQSPPRLIVRVEEIEKALAGSQTDSSGTTQDAMQVLLSQMEDYNYSGCAFAGPPGSGKSLFSKAMSMEYGVLSIAFDLNATKASLVGQSEANVRNAMKVIRTIGGSDVLFIATANKLNTVPPELRRRFRYGTWMFDLPNEDELESVWKINKSRYSIPEDDNLTSDSLGHLSGADIRNLCELSWKLNCSLDEAADFVVPFEQSNQAEIKESRKIADGKFLSASYPGPYRISRKPKRTRKVTV